MKIKFMFALYDFWVGFFWDKKKRYLYFFPIPCFGVRVSIPPKCKECNDTREVMDEYERWMDCPYC